jgi:tetratricopeptide (TPR) repeat protein
MNNSKQFFLLISCTFLLFACGRTPREQSKIPPAPTESEKMRDVAALEALTDAIRSNSSVPENYYKRALIYLQFEKNQEAVDDITRADRLKPNTGKYLYVKGLTLRNTGKIDEALAAAQSAEILNVDTPELYTLLGDLSQQKNDFKKSEAYLAKSLQFAPFNGETFFYKGQLSARRGDTIAAINNLLRATQLKPKLLPAYSQLTTIFKNRGYNDSALVFNAKAMKNYPDNANLYVERGLVYQNIGKLDSAVYYFEKSAEINPERVEGLIYAGTIYFRWKSYLKAVEVYEAALKQSPNLAKVYYLTGLCYEKLGSYSKAEEYFKTANEKDPKDGQIAAAYSKISGQINSVINTEPTLANYPKRPKNAVPKKVVVEEPQRLLDTTRLRISVIAPKARVSIKADSSRRIKIN